jgi:hemerythrin superfamily protein
MSPLVSLPKFTPVSPKENLAMATTNTKSTDSKSTDTKKSQTRSSNGKSSGSTRRRKSEGGSGSERGALFGGSSGALLGAAVAGVAVGLAANYGRKLIMQTPAFVSGTWDEALKTEHAMTLSLFDQLEATDDKATGTRTGLLMKIKYALSKHALQEENVIYPALREANETADADELNSEHGYVKSYLYELENMPKASAEFMARVKSFRSMLEEHIREEEDRIFPALRAKMSDEQNRKLTLAMNREGLKLA